MSIIKSKKKGNELKIVESKGESVGPTRYYPPAIQEWKNSIYTFNKNTSKIIPIANSLIFILIKSYFNMFSKKVERKIKLPRIRRWKRRLHGRKIWISKPELKYSNDKIIVNIYIYNRQYTYFLNKLYKLKLTWGKRLKITLTKKWKKRNILLKKRKIFFRDKWIKAINKINKKSLKFYNSLGWVSTLNKNAFFSKKTAIISECLIKLNKETSHFIFNTSYIRLIKRILKYQILILKNKQIILLNKLKFKDTYLLPLIYLMQKIYNKNIEFNLISLRKFYHNSSILAQIVTSKIRNRRNKPLKVVKTSIRKSRIYVFNKNILFERNKLVGRQNYIISNFIHSYNKGYDYLNNVLDNKLYKYDKGFENVVLSSTKNKIITGIKVQASGRITRRIIAQRAQCKIRYKGTLRNIDSVYKGLSTVILKGHEKSTLQYTHLSSKRRIGAFGLKGWINSY